MSGIHRLLELVGLRRTEDSQELFGGIRFWTLLFLVVAAAATARGVDALINLI
jgi:hypothetical protein